VQAFTYNDLLKTGPGTIAGRYLRRFWQPVATTTHLKPGQAKPIRVMSEDFALYRGEDGTPHVVDSRCLHRGAKMSLGWVEGNSLRCAYHGWKYDSSGQCVEQPAEPKPFCERIKIRSFPTCEYLGLIFTYFGEGDPPPLVRLPEYEDFEFYHELSNDVWPTNYFAQLENALDYAHTEFLHWQFHYKTPSEVVSEETPFGLKLHTPGLSGLSSYYDTGYFLMPNAHEWAAPPRQGEKIGNYAIGWRVPRDDESHIRFNLAVFPLRGQEAEAYRERNEARKEQLEKSIVEYSDELLRGDTSLKEIRNRNITGSGLINIQDCALMASLGPMATREHHEQLGRTDAGIVKMRRLWRQELEALSEGRELREWRRPNVLWEQMSDV
jgi:5,5'-dehydrodivanillate O-demethylase